MSRLFLILFAILTIFSVSAQSTRFGCPKHEIWNDCGTSCPPTCENPRPEICNMMCREGCECRPGFLRNKDGQCVHRFKC
ncbi:chymotrypsin inhibitor-like [Colletes latitarsis]|uniref:chymotrypsin inhibitor-like n=1 Tax=Colletes latitarsis TaxID=2605962 RepID=UPI0040367547